MSAPIIITNTQHESWESQVQRAAIQYSGNPEKEEAFIDGAKWQRGDGNGVSGFAILIILYLIIQSLVCVFGTLDGSSDYIWQHPVQNKWKYVFPGYNLGFALGRWLSDKE